MSNACFVTQEATQDILLRVTNVCAECYSDIVSGDTIHYDMQNYRYICMSCQERLCALMNENCEVVEDESAALF
jgi:frataxin-like iron-binding protein CyaY